MKVDMHKKPNLNRFFSSFSHITVLSLLAILVWSSCDSGGEEAKPEEETTLVGQYQIDSVVLTSDVSFNDDTPYKGFTTGKNVSTIVTTAFFSVHTCTAAGNIALDLKSNNELYFVCLQEDNEAKVGTWASKLEDTELSLNLAPPLFPVSYPLSMKDVKFDAATLSGNSVGLPIPVWIIDGDTPPDNPLEPTDPKNQLVGGFSVTFFFKRV